MLKESLGSVQLELLSARVCVYICRRRFTHLLHYCRTQGRSQASSGMSSVLFHKHLLIYGHLPSFCSVALRPLPEQPPSPSISFPLPLITHTYTLLLMLVSSGQSRECLLSVQEAMWLILIWSPVLMACVHDQQASAGCVLVFGGFRLHL